MLVVWKLDRLGRNLAHLVNTAQDLSTRGVGLRVLAGQGEQIDTTTADGRLVFGVFAARAEFEQELIRERTLAGLQAAMAQRNTSVIRTVHSTRDQTRDALDALDAAEKVEDLKLLTLGTHALKGNRKGEWGMTVTKNWRIITRTEGGTWLEIWRDDRRIQAGCYVTRSRLGNSIRDKWRILSVSGAGPLTRFAKDEDR